MKKIIFAIFAATAFLASCTKEVPVAEPQDIKVKFTVADKAAFGADTKAIKAGWEVGDEIVLIFHSGTEWLDYSNSANTVKLTKTAGGWTADASNATLASLTGEKYYAVHHLGQMTLGSFSGTEAKFTNYKGGEYLTAEGVYSINGTNLELGTITMQRDPLLSQFSVKDLTVESGDTWELTIYAIIDNKMSTTSVAQCGVNAMRLISGGAIPSIGKYGVYEASGVQNGSDVSFCFKELSIRCEYEGSDLCYELKRKGTKYKTYYYRTTTKKFDDFDGHAFSLPSLESEKWKATFAELIQ